jgi:CMP/dCMP kinase
MIIAIDGPSGAGKSTLGKLLAKRLGLLYLDTGAMYRAVAVSALHKGVSFEEADNLVKTAERTKIELIGEPDSLQVYLDGENVTAEIRTLEVAQAASVASTVAGVRRAMVKQQRQIGLGAPNGCVLEGRDIGSIVFPKADVKFFLTARPEARARRRYEEDHAKGIVSTYEQTLAEINQRDERDVSRTDSPLVIADDAIVIDTSELDLKEVLEQMLSVISQKANAAA